MNNYFLIHGSYGNPYKNWFPWLNPYVPKLKAEKFAEFLNAQKIEIKNAGHFNEKFGYKEFGEILEYIF